MAGLISCRSAQSFNSLQTIEPERINTIELPDFTTTVYDWLLNDSIVYISASDGVYYLNIDESGNWKKLSNQAFKSIDVFDFSMSDGRVLTVLTALAAKQNVIHFLELDLKRDTLISVSAGEIPSGVDLTVELTACYYDSVLRLYVSGYRGLIEQWELYDPGWGQVDGKVVKQFSSPMFNKFLVNNCGYLAGAYPDKGWWSMRLADSQLIHWDITKHKSLKGKKIQAFTIAQIKRKPLILVLLDDGSFFVFDPDTAKQVGIIKLNTVETGVPNIKSLLTDRDGRLTLLKYTGKNWKIETYSSE